jgi:hypothetical protein
MGANLTDLLVQTSPEQRYDFLATLPEYERRAVMGMVTRDRGTPWALFEDDPVGFVRVGLGESIWSKQAEILESIRDNRRTAVPACHAPGKSHLAARAVAWWVSVHPPGTAMVATTAATFRQVRAVLWPHIRRLVNRHNLPGTPFMVEWQIDSQIVAHGFSPSDHDETAVQGLHAPHLLIVVDEAGGIGATLGQGIEALMTGGHTRLLVIGNPPTDHEDSWFEKCCNSPLYNVIPISAYDTPNFTGEDAGICRSCPPEVPEHPVAEHLVDQEWAEDVLSEFGEDSAFVQARVLARFPRSTANKVIPYGWAEGSADNEDPLDGNAIRLGVDVAADGGDEFVIAVADGYRVEIAHRSSGEQNANPVDVAGVILKQIHEAEAEHLRRDVDEPVRVKVDAIGVGWGVAGLLERWGQEGKHRADIVAINVSERASQPDKFSNQRAEMWWNGRRLMQPSRTEEGDKRCDVKLVVDRRTLAQMSGPTYRSDSSGRIVIEPKKDMKRRGVSSPDRAEAVLLALYEPPGRKPIPDIAPMSFTQTNSFDMGGTIL